MENSDNSIPIDTVINDENRLENIPGLTYAYLNIEEICETFEQDARRYKRYLGTDIKVMPS